MLEESTKSHRESFEVIREEHVRSRSVAARTQSSVPIAIVDCPARHFRQEPVRTKAEAGRQAEALVNWLDRDSVRAIGLRLGPRSRLADVGIAETGQSISINFLFLLARAQNGTIASSSGEERAHRACQKWNSVGAARWMPGEQEHD
jgi:hypothetical protein